MLNRRAATLIELLVAVALACIVLGSATTSVLRQQQTHSRIASVSGADGQLRAATWVLASQLAFIDPSSGDLSAGEADDTVLQFRAPIAASLACNRSIGAVTFLPDSGPSMMPTGAASLPRSGDSLWWLGDSAWAGRRINSVATIAAACTLPVAAAGSAVHLTLAASGDTIPAGAPLRVTRQTRYGVYRSGDGTWQLGFREWSEASGAFSAPQPVAGPLLLRSSGRQSGFRYFDNTDQELATTGAPLDVARIARIRITTQSLARIRARGQDSVRTDSVDVSLGRARGGT